MGPLSEGIGSGVGVTIGRETGAPSQATRRDRSRTEATEGPDRRLSWDGQIGTP